jgi:hypothetical protein
MFAEEGRNDQYIGNSAAMEPACVLMLLFWNPGTLLYLTKTAIVGIPITADASFM